MRALTFDLVEAAGRDRVVVHRAILELHGVRSSGENRALCRAKLKSLCSGQHDAFLT